MRMLRAADYRRMAWKNGGGETAEIVVFPEGAGLGAFDWRVSMATVTADGPFSTFPGVDRTLSILEGEGLMLSVEGRIPIGLTSRSGPLTFPADVTTSAALIAGPVTDLNVMTRRGRCAHKVSRLAVDGAIEDAVGTGVTILFCAMGSLRVVGRDFDKTLGRYDATMMADRHAGVRVEGKGEFFLIELDQPA